MKKILFTDLDGTLLKNDKTVSGKNREAIHCMLAAGHYVVAATGRSVEGGLSVIRSLGLAAPGCYMIAFNGAVIYDCGADCIRKEYTLPLSHVRYLFSEAERYGLYIQTYEGAYVVTERQCRELAYYTANTGTTGKVTEHIADMLKTEPNKVLLISLDEPEKLLQFEADHREWARNRATSVFSCREYLEYCPPGIDKGTGIRSLRELLGVRPEDTYAVGDECNDIPMIRAAGMGIAMKNGVPEAKAAADYVTEHDNEQDAIAEIIEKFILDESKRM